MNLGRRHTDDGAGVKLGVATVQLGAPSFVPVGVRPLDTREEPGSERQAVSRGQSEKALFEVFRELRLGHVERVSHRRGPGETTGKGRRSLLKSGGFVRECKLGSSPRMAIHVRPAAEVEAGVVGRAKGFTFDAGGLEVLRRSAANHFYWRVVMTGLPVRVGMHGAE